MLVLSRKKDEELHLGDDIRIKVVRITGGRVRLGIVAPKSIEVRRGKDRPENRPADRAS